MICNRFLCKKINLELSGRFPDTHLYKNIIFNCKFSVKTNADVFSLRGATAGPLTNPAAVLLHSF